MKDAESAQFTPSSFSHPSHLTISSTTLFLFSAHLLFPSSWLVDKLNSIKPTSSWPVQQPFPPNFFLQFFQLNLKLKLQGGHWVDIIDHLQTLSQITVLGNFFVESFPFNWISKDLLEKARKVDKIKNWSIYRRCVRVGSIFLKTPVAAVQLFSNRFSSFFQVKPEAGESGNLFFPIFSSIFLQLFS